MYYTYLYIDPRTNDPFYIGKGHGGRVYKHLKGQSKKQHPHLHNTIQKLLRERRAPRIQIINCQSENEAFELERFLIAEIGRKDLGLGPLLNLTDGGEGISSPSIETRRKISASRKGKPSPMKGRRGAEGWCKGLNKDTDSRVAALADLLKNKDWGDTRRGSNNANFGNHPVFDDISRANMAIAHVGLKWITNGLVEAQIKKTEPPPDGFRYNRLKRNR